MDIENLWLLHQAEILPSFLQWEGKDSTWCHIHRFSIPFISSWITDLLHQVEIFPPWIYVGWFKTYWSMWFTDNNLKEVKIQKMKSLARIPAGVATLLEPFFNTFPHSVQGCSVKWKSGSLTKSSMNEIDLLLPIDWTLGPLLLLLLWEYKSLGRKTFHVMILYRFYKNQEQDLFFFLSLSRWAWIWL